MVPEVGNLGPVEKTVEVVLHQEDPPVMPPALAPELREPGTGQAEKHERSEPGLEPPDGPGVPHPEQEGHHRRAREDQADKPLGIEGEDREKVEGEHLEKAVVRLVFSG